MDERRFRLYVSILISLFVFTGIRYATDTNPIYSLGEPVFSWLQDFSKEVRLTGNPVAEPNDATSARNTQLESQNQQLRDELEISEALASRSAEVTRRDVLGYRKFVWINIGRNQGVANGETVMHRDALFGTIIEVYDDSSLVQTVLDPDFRATIRVGDEQGVLKVSHGSLIADLVPSKTLNKASIVTDGLGGANEAGVFVGVSDELAADDSSVFGSYNVLLPYSLYDVDFVDVINRGDQ